jgi:antitoxin MazE
MKARLAPLAPRRPGIYIVYPKERAMKVKVAKWGNGLGLRLPEDAVQAAGLEVGSEVDLTVEGKELRLRRAFEAFSSRELLDEMIAEARRLGPEKEPPTVDWGPDRGSEILNDDDPR